MHKSVNLAAACCWAAVSLCCVAAPGEWDCIVVYGSGATVYAVSVTPQ